MKSISLKDAYSFLMPCNERLNILKNPEYIHKNMLSRQAIDSILYFLKQHPWILAGVFFLGVLYSVTESLSIGIVLPVLHQMLQHNPSEIGNGRIVSVIFSIAKIIPNVQPLISALIIVSVATLAKNIFGYSREVLSVFLGLKLREECQEKIFSQLLRTDYNFFLNRKKGDLQYRVITAPDHMGNLIMIFPNLMTEVLKCVTIAALLFLINFKITLLMCFVGLFFFMAIKFLASNVSHYTGTGRAEASSDMTVYCNQALLGIKVLKVFKAEKFWENLFNSAQKKFFSLARKDTVYLYMPSRLMETLTIILLCALTGWLFISNGAAYMSKIVPLIGLFAVAIQRIIPSFNIIGRDFMRFISLVPYGEATYTAIKESRIDNGTEKLPLSDFNKEVSFENVTLSYNQEIENVLKSINFKIQKGDFLAIVGKSGAGKTSIVDLLLKMRNPTSGNIFVDSMPLRHIDSNHWYKLIGYVGQETFVFNGSIRDNVLFGLENVSDDRVLEALYSANAMEFVNRMESGIDSMIGDEGLNLSGGQRQRIAIARALIREPEIIIFDEATSSLDSISEKLIRDSLLILSQKKTIIVVSHKLSSVIDAGHVVVLDNGKIVETGTPEYLLQKDTHFSELYDQSES